MGLIHRYQGPFELVRGVATAITFDVYNDAGTQQTASAATVTITAGDETIVDAAAATGLGPPLTYTVTAAATTDRAVAEDWLAVASTTISGSPHTFSRRISLVRRVFQATITDTDLTDLHTELADFLAGASTTALDISSYSKYRVAAEERIRRDLRRKGRRPHLMFDPDDLHDAHVALSLAYIFRDFRSVIGPGKYKELSEEYFELYKEEFANVATTYDDDETGTITSTETLSAQGPIVLTAGPRRWSTKYSTP